MSKLFSTEVASVVAEKNVVELSEKFKTNRLEADDREAIEVLDTFAKEIANTGRPSENGHIVSELIKKSVEPLVFNPDQSILYNMFDFDGIGEFDETRYTGLPKNTIVVHDSARGGNVPKSYVDPGIFTPVSVALQAETELSYSDLRRNGWKTIAKMTELARESFEQELFFRLFAGIDAALDTTSGAQNITGGSALTTTNADLFSRYLRDMGDGQPFMVGLSKYIDEMAHMTGHEKYLSDDLKNELNRLGRVSMYNGVVLSSVPTARKTAKGLNLIPDKRIFGVAGKIGEANMRGDLRMYETYDNNAEKVHLKFTGFDFDYVIYYLDKIARITFS